MAHYTRMLTESTAYYHTMLCVAITQPKDRPMKLIWTREVNDKWFFAILIAKLGLGFWALTTNLSCWEELQLELGFRVSVP